MPKLLNTELLATMVKRRRGSTGLRTAAKEIGNLTAPTLSRVEQGKVPDVETFIKICRWLEMKTDAFVLDAPDESGVGARKKDLVVSHLRGDRELSPETIETLLKVLDLAYAREEQRR